MVGFGGTVALVVQTMQTMGATVEQTGSAVTALCLGIALCGAVLAIALRMPIVLAWSTPGAALLAASASHISWSTAVGAFILAGIFMAALGIVPALGRAAERIPAAVASAMLAGVLLPFCLALFRAAGQDPLLVGAVLLVFLAARQRVPLHALLLVLATGSLLSLLRGDIAPLPAGATFGTLAPVLPTFDLGTAISLALPLFLVTLVSQNLPGLVVLRSASYAPSPRPLLVGTGLTTATLAFFGAFAVNLAAITAAICTSADAHPDRERRWTVGLLYALFYLVLAAFAPLLVRFFLSLPHHVITVLTGAALIPALMGALEVALDDRSRRDAAIVTFLVAGSGVTLHGLGAAFWALAAGGVALAIRTALTPAPGPARTGSTPPDPRRSTQETRSASPPASS